MPAAAAPEQLTVAPAIIDPAALAAPITTLPGAGVVLVPLAAVSAAAAVDCFVAIQGPRLASFGLAGDELRRYGEYFIRNGRGCPYSLAAASVEGQLAGILVFFDEPHGADGLPRVAAEHRRLALACGAAAAGMCPKGEKLPEIVFGGLVPSFQGKNLIWWLQKEAGAIALRLGRRRYWSWTLNLDMMKAQGKGNTTLWVASKLADIMLRLPAWFLNRGVYPFYHLVGILPKGTEVCMVPKAGHPLIQGQPNDAVVGVVPFPRPRPAAPPAAAAPAPAAPPRAKL